MAEVPNLEVPVLGPCRFDSPMLEGGPWPTMDEPRRVLLHSSIEENLATGRPLEELPAFEGAGPRGRLYFDPAATRAGIVTCGGLCPGLNDVIRGLVMVLWYRYGVRHIEGYRFGYEGLNPAIGHEPMALNPEVVGFIHEQGGTLLGSSRGPQDPDVVVDFLRSRGVNVLFAIGGDGTLRGAADITAVARHRGLELAVIGVPKTIDNDIPYVEQSFGFDTAVTRAVESVRTVHIEALGARGGVGLVKLMGRHSGFIAAYATLASNHANYALIPEVDFPLEGENGLLEHVRRRVLKRGHAVIVAAEGAGQRYVPAEGTDRSGNPLLGDIGTFLRDRIQAYLREKEVAHTVRYIDPSYLIRGVPATAFDSVYCFRLAALAVHAAMAGRTGMVVGRWRGRYVHIPIERAASGRQQVDPHGDFWLSVLEATGQPRWAVSSAAGSG